MVLLLWTLLVAVKAVVEEIVETLEAFETEFAIKGSSCSLLEHRVLPLLSSIKFELAVIFKVPEGIL